jgi:hypothetical protein
MPKEPQRVRVLRRAAAENRERGAWMGKNPHHPEKIYGKLALFCAQRHERIVIAAHT